MINSKLILEEAKRIVNSVDVIVRLCSSTTNGFSFKVLKTVDSKTSKYIGEISKDHKSDECTCSSFMFGNNENYKKTNPLPFQCKHVIKAHSIMEGFW